MPLRQLDGVPAALGFLAERGARALTVDSRRVRAGDAFVAWPGHAVDARRFVADALGAGAAACLVEADGAGAFDLDGTRGGAVAALRGLKAATGEIADGFMGRPSEQLAVIAVTGTNGKTSTAWWCAQALAALGTRCGVVGTLGMGEPPRDRVAQGEPPRDGGSASLVPTGLTTPDPVTLQAALRRFADDGVRACAIEASSIGLVEHRLAGTRIRVAAFTNFTQDHLDFHGTMDAYWQAKAQLFAWPGLQAAVVNADDARGAALAETLAARPGAAPEVWTYSVRPAAAAVSPRGAARLVASAVRHGADGLAFDVREGAASAAVATRLIGDFNVSNLLAVIGSLRALGVPLAAAARACAALTPVPGRMQRVDIGGDGAPLVVVDYAHTPDGLDKALLALAPTAAVRGGVLWCVFGCGGNRDAGKRPLMGAVAARRAGRLVVTSDNPRDEAPAEIVAQVLAGVPPGTAVEAIVDRAEAIAHALRGAAPRDVVVIAGKGHEDYQETAGVRRPFSDAAVAGAALRARSSAVVAVRA